MKFFLFLFILSCYACHSGENPVPNKKDSLIILQDSLKRKPDNPSLWIDLYRLQLNRKDTMGAINSLNHYLEMVKEDENAGLEFAWLLAYKKDSNAIQVTNWLMKSNDQTIAVKALYIQAHYYGNIGSWEKALQHLDAVIQANYQFTDAYIQKGIIHFEQAKYEEALSIFLMGLKIEPSNKALYYWMAVTHKALGHEVEAEDWQKKYEALQ